MTYIPTGGSVITASGTYTPTLTSVANIAGSTAYLCQYMRVGAVVTVSGRVDIAASLNSTVTQLYLSLPIASSINSAEKLGGVGAVVNAAGFASSISCDSSKALFSYTAANTSNNTFSFTFTYQLV